MEVEIGIDEAGVGTLAGPLVVACVALPRGLVIEGVRDSKKMTMAGRQKAIERIHQAALFQTVMVGPADQVDAKGVWGLWQHLVDTVLRSVWEEFPAQDVVIDGNRGSSLRSSAGAKLVPIIKADSTHHAVSAASVCAKWTQTQMMEQIHRENPAYGFDAHKGYPTQEHLARLKALGACSYHRTSYEPVRRALELRATVKQ